MYIFGRAYNVLYLYTSMLFSPPVAEYASSMAILAAVFLLFYLIALIVISRYTKELVLALFSGRLCGNNVDVEEDEEDGVESRDEETDGGPKQKPPTNNEPELLEMEELHSSSIPGNGAMQSSVSTPECHSTAQTISRGTRIHHPTLRRQRTYSESSSGGGGAKCKPSVLDILSGRYEDYRVRADSESRRGTGSSTVGEGGRHGSNNPTAPSSSEHPQTPSTVMPSTPLDSIKEEDTARIASHPSESNRGSGSGSGSGTPVLTGRHSPASSSRRNHLGLNLQKTVSKEEKELLTPPSTSEPVSSGLRAMAAQASSTEPAVSSIGTLNAVTVQTQPKPEVSDPIPHDVESPPSSAASPPTNGQLEEREERSSSAQPLTEQEESTVIVLGSDDGKGAVELGSEDCKDDFPIDLSLEEMTFPEGKAAQQQSNR